MTARRRALPRDPVAFALGVGAGAGAPVALIWNLANADDLGALVAAVWFLPAPVTVGAGALAGTAAALRPGWHRRGGSGYRSVLGGAVLGVGGIGLGVLVGTVVAGDPVSASTVVGVAVIAFLIAVLSAIGAGLGILLGVAVRRLVRLLR